MAALKKILLVEDDSFLSDIYVTKFEEAGYIIDLADNGREGLRRAGELMPDLILLDIILPKMNGLEVLAALKNDAKTKNIPIVILSNLSADEDVKKGLEIGADAYLIKSQFTPSEVVAKVEEILK